MLTHQEEREGEGRRGKERKEREGRERWRAGGRDRKGWREGRVTYLWFSPSPGWEWEICFPLENSYQHALQYYPEHTLPGVF